ncbi:MAG: asparaginase domain-containing protein [Planctomycetota bacterium]
MRRLTLISTGGTIEKTYDEMTGVLANHQSIVQEMLGLLRLEDTAVNSIQLLSKDSNDLTDADRARILAQVRLLIGPDNARSDAAPDDSASDGVIILHGTDTLAITGELLHTQLNGSPRVPVILTGAMRPFEMKRSDALQNLNEAIFAAGQFTSGVWCVAHGRALPFPGVVKDRSIGTFVPAANA